MPATVATIHASLYCAFRATLYNAPDTTSEHIAAHVLASITTPSEPTVG